VVGLIAMLIALGWFGEYEWVRESLRKPYVIYDYMYGNAVELNKVDDYERDGYLAHITFKTGDDGADLFRHACRSCHTMTGYKPLKYTFDGTDETFIAGTIMGATAIKANMPPFLGTEEEAQLIASHIYKQVDQRHISEIYNLSGLALGKKVYDIRCGKCHEINGFNDKSESLIGLDEETYADILDMAGDFADEMPEFTGDDMERQALIEYLMSLEEGDLK
jgi:mono/diheme cytochrome c family protein